MASRLLNGLRPAVALVALLALAPAAGAATLAGTASGGAIPARGATIRAVDASSGLIAAAADLRPGGRFALRVPPGPYTLLTSVVTASGARGSITPIAWARGASRVRVPVSLRRARPRREAPPRRRSGARDMETLPAPIVAVKRFLVSGPDTELGPGLADMVLTDMVGGGTDACSPRMVEWERRGDVVKERAFQNSKYVDPRTRVRGPLLQPQVFVEGAIRQNADGSVSYQVMLTDAKTGDTLGGDHGTLPPGGDLLEVAPQVAGHLTDQLCGGSYDVNLALTTTAEFATHTSSGTLNATLTARATKLGGPGIPVSFFAEGPLAYRDMVFGSRMADCTYIDPVPVDGTWAVSLEVTAQGRLKVTWLPGTGGPRGIASVACRDAAPIPGQPGPSLIQPEPVQFELPVEGGSVPIGGGFTEGADGWRHRGTIFVTRRPGF